ncbi:hypothetical protein N0V84_001440 [Fusarium piperis]|uniref:Uncharacterized protein n=1 Tax=Fusarium piperis TaxID=1435070 RepID=A0A9W8WL42_9HYPO|nr:hypothetical protein N0V84_001440 [Fusarium piperis]
MTSLSRQFVPKADPEEPEGPDEDDESGLAPCGGPSSRAGSRRKADGDLAYRPRKRPRSAAHKVTHAPPLKAGTCGADKAGVPKVANDDDDESPSDEDGIAEKMAEALAGGRLIVVPDAQPDGDVTDDVFRMAAAICSRDALKQFVDAVRHWRDHRHFARHTSEHAVPEGTSPDTCALVKRCVQIQNGQKRSECEHILGRNNDL